MTPQYIANGGTVIEVTSTYSTSTRITKRCEEKTYRWLGLIANITQEQINVVSGTKSQTPHAMGKLDKIQTFTHIDDSTCVNTD